jgi:hypothetical protein
MGVARGTGSITDLRLSFIIYELLNLNNYVNGHYFTFFNRRFLPALCLRNVYQPTDAVSTHGRWVNSLAVVARVFSIASLREEIDQKTNLEKKPQQGPINQNNKLSPQRQPRRNTHPGRHTRAREHERPH